MIPRRARNSSADRAANEAVNKALNDPDIKEKITSGGNEVGGGDPSVFAKFVAAESDRWGKLIKAKGIKPE